MSVGLLMKETMSGWIEFNDEGKRHPFSFTIRAFTTKLFSLTAPRAFHGRAEFGDGGECVETKGTLTIYPTGPKYQLDVSLKDYGNLYLEGKKEYSLTDLKRSLTTCPLTVYKDGQAIGTAEVAYRDSLISFPFTALQLVKEEDAYLRFSQ